MLLCARAASRRFRNVFSANGQPQWRRKTTIVDPVPSLTFVVCGALEPMAGGAVCGAWSFGANQDDNSWVNDMILARAEADP